MLIYLCFCDELGSEAVQVEFFIFGFWLCFLLDAVDECLAIHVDSFYLHS
jgi:hypothetical protein